jgi:hypothetical protein
MIEMKINPANTTGPTLMVIKERFLARSIDLLGYLKGIKGCDQ